MVLAVGLAGTGCAVIAREVALLGVGYLGEAIFTNVLGLGDDEHGIEDTSDGGQANGDSIGLYGGTTHKAHCDRNKLIEFLENPENADKAEVWAQVLGITVSGVRRYVRGLTPFILRRDTLVKNHGFKKEGKKGKAIIFDAIIEAGVAVLVDQFGTPRVRCACGNPLTTSDVDVTSSRVEYKGTPWTGFRERRATVVKAGNQVDTFTFQDRSGQYVSRKSGTDGTDDRAQPAAPPRLALSASSVKVGGAYTATATGFSPGEQVRFSWTGPSSGTIGAVSADAQGRASTEVHEGASPGRYTITATGLRSGRTASAPLEVVQSGPTSNPRLALSASSVKVGGAYTATATGFSPGEQVRFSWTGPSSGTIGAVSADAQGRASMSVYEGASPGRYTITATGLTSGRTASAPLEVV